MSSSDTENELEFGSASEAELGDEGSETGSEEDVQPSATEGGRGQNVRLLGARHAGVDVMEGVAESLISIQVCTWRRCLGVGSAKWRGRGLAD